MAEGPKQGSGSGVFQAGSEGRAAGRDPVEAFATQVLSLVAANSETAVRAVKQSLVDELIASSRSFAPDAQETVLASFSKAGVTPRMIVDLYIPAAARQLGAAWCEDDLSFADVTIGVSRLQAMMRELRAPETNDMNAPHILVLVPRDAYHTLGSSVLADQLRRLGASVRMAVGITPNELSGLISQHDFDAVMISAAACERLESIRELVKAVKTASARAPQIVLGGSVLDQQTDTRALTGVDHISNNAEEALLACGLMIQTRAAVSPEVRG
ncbi:MAG: cobalamin B12-binding domain-containing protein [Pseudomonadota bacterium]